jgi:hypothetical protein
MILAKGKGSEISMERGRFRELDQDLRRRGFVERERRKHGEHVRVDAFNSAILWKSFSGFDVICGAREDLGGFARDLPVHGGDLSRLPMFVWVKYESEGGGGLRMLSHLFSRKSHYLSESSASRWGSQYVADLVPGEDAGAIIGLCIAFDEAVSRIRDDASYAKGMDAKEIFETVSASLRGISDGNSFKRHVREGMDTWLLGWWNLYSSELERMKLDQDLGRSMQAVADK